MESVALHYGAVPMVGTAADTVSDIARWLTSDPLHDLVDVFGGELGWLEGPIETLADRLLKLDAFTERWDARQGKERNEADELDLTPQQVEVTLAAAVALGHAGIRAPRFQHYDHVLMLGGLIRACLSRPAYAASLVDSGAVTADTFTALGGHRPFVGDEFALAAANGLPELTEEYEALDVGTRRAFGLGEPYHVEGESSELVGGAWGVRSYRSESGLNIHVAAAPSSDPVVRRADTADTYQFFATNIAHLRPGQRLLMITTAIYVPPQHIAGVRMLALPLGVEVDTIGTVPAGAKPTDPLPYTASKYLLEVRATIGALRRLVATVSDMPTVL